MFSTTPNQFKTWFPYCSWSHWCCIWTHALLVTSVGEDDQSFTKCRHCSPDRETCCNCAKISDIFAKLIKNDHPGDPGTLLGQHFCKLHSLTPTVVDAMAPDPVNPSPLRLPVAGGEVRAIKRSHFRFFPSWRFLLRQRLGRVQASCQKYQLAPEEGSCKKMFESEYQFPGFGVFLICTLQKGSNKCIPMVANFHSWIFMDLFCLKSICLCLWDCVRNGKRRIPE